MNKSKHSRLTVIAIVLFIALLLVAIGIIFTALLKDESDELPNVEDMAATLKKTPDYGQNYIDSIIFLGDGSLRGLSALLAEESTQIWCEKDGGLPLDHNTYSSPVVIGGEEMILSDALRVTSTRFLIITVGYENGVPFCDKDTFKDYYSRLIEAVKAAAPDTAVMLQGVLPVSKDFADNNRGYTAEKTREASVWICELAEEHGVRFLNTPSALCDSDGYLKDEYSDGDKMNAEGYAKMLEYIRTHGYKAD